MTKFVIEIDDDFNTRVQIQFSGTYNKYLKSILWTVAELINAMDISDIEKTDMLHQLSVEMEKQTKHLYKEFLD